MALFAVTLLPEGQGKALVVESSKTDAFARARKGVDVQLVARRSGLREA